MKIYLITVFLLAAQSLWASEDLNMTLRELSQLATRSVTAHYAQEYQINLSQRDVENITIESIGKNSLSISAIAPSHQKDEAIPNYCAIELSRDSEYASYKPTSIDCSKYD